MHDQYGIAGQTAPEFRFDHWLDNVDGDLRIADIDEPVIYLYNFQSWCPGCHSHGFPTLDAVRTALETDGFAAQVKFIAIQTVFEGHDTNTADAARESLGRHGLSDLALGHDSGHPPTIMSDYRTGGTPWTVVIGPQPDRTVLFNGFQLDADDAVELVEGVLVNHQTSSPAATAADERNFAMNKQTMNKDGMDKDDLGDRLTKEQYEVTQNGGTERPFTGIYWDTKTDGEYRCVVCDEVLFDSATKFDSGTGWPSFSAESEDGRVRRIVDGSHGMVRTEARCNNCDAHLGHVFPDGPGGERYCMNSASLRLEPSESVQ
jgi:peptide-methionine (R)-S-oxide reductase